MGCQVVVYNMEVSTSKEARICLKLTLSEREDCSVRHGGLIDVLQTVRTHE